MARNNFVLVTPTAVALVAATAKTVLQLVNPSASIILAVQQLKISFDGVSNTAVPVIVQLLRKAAAATVTSQTRTKIKDTSTALVTDAATTGVNATIEGTDGAIIETWHVHPQTGAFDMLPLPEGEVEVPGSGIIAVKVNAPAAVNTLVTLVGEE